jgi:hypothetical protein
LKTFGNLTNKTSEATTIFTTISEIESTTMLPENVTELIYKVPSDLLKPDVSYQNATNTATADSTINDLNIHLDNATTTTSTDGADFLSFGRYN